MGELHEPSAVILSWNYNNAPDASCEWGRKNKPILNGSPQIWATLRDCIIKKRGGRRRRKRRRKKEVRFFLSLGAQSALCFIQPLFTPPINPRSGAQRWRKASRFISGWKQGSCRWDHLPGHVFMTFTCKSAVSSCSNWLLGKRVRCCLDNLVCSMCAWDVWARFFTFFLLFIYFSSSIFSFEATNPFWVKNLAQTFLSAPWPLEERERERLPDQHLVPVLWSRPAPGLLPLGWATISPKESLLTP